MDQNEKKVARMSVPEFGGWDNYAAGATDYSMVFTQARENKKHQKTDLSELKRMSIEKERNLKNATHQKNHHHHHNHHHHRHHHAHVHRQAQAQPHEDPALMGKRRVLTYINCCIRP